MKRNRLACLAITAGLLCSSASRAADPLKINRVRAVVAGKIITHEDVLMRQGNRHRQIRDANGRLVMDPEQLLTEMINEALFVRSIKIHERFKALAERPGRGEELLNQEVANRYENNREALVNQLRAQGKTVEQRMAELVDEELLDIAQSLVTDSVQASPAAVEQYLKDHPEEAGKGQAVKAYRARIPETTEGMTVAKAKEIAAGIKTAADLKKLATKHREENEGDLGWIYENESQPLPPGVSRDHANEMLSFGDPDGPASGSWVGEEFHHIVFIEKFDKNRKIPGDELRRMAERRLLNQLQTKALEKSIRRLRQKIPWRRLDE